MESILVSIKKLLGLSEEYDAFDMDIIIHINTVISILAQEGVGPNKAFAISDSSATWLDFTGDDTNIEMVKSLVFLRVRMLFDPPTSSAVIESINNTIKELETRLYYHGNFEEN